MDLVEFRFPLAFDRTSGLCSTMINHTSAIDFDKDVKIR